MKLIDLYNPTHARKLVDILDNAIKHGVKLHTIVDRIAYLQSAVFEQPEHQTAILHYLSLDVIEGEKFDAVIGATLQNRINEAAQAQRNLRTFGNLAPPGGFSS